jgi:multidrug resistance efflux pump
MSELPVIPRPLAQRWNDFRLRAAPFGVFIVALVCTAWLWNKNWGPMTFMGEVQAPQATVACPQAGYLAEVTVQQYGQVEQGDVVAVVKVSSDQTLGASLEAIRSDLGVMRVRMSQDQQRNQQNHQQMRFDWLDQRVDLAVARANLQFAESELKRAEELHRNRVSSDAEYEMALDQRDALKVEVEERIRLTEEMERTIEGMSPGAPAGEDPEILRAITAAIAAQEAQLEQSEGAVKLRAPIRGVVTSIPRRPGEAIMAGEPLVEITGAEPERIVGYIRQPIGFQPRQGDMVEVRTRGNNRQSGMTQVTAVGARLELFSQSLRIRGFDSSMERGLPVLLGVPLDMHLYPGELVDLYLQSHDRNAN